MDPAAAGVRSKQDNLADAARLAPPRRIPGSLAQALEQHLDDQVEFTLLVWRTMIDVSAHGSA